MPPSPQAFVDFNLDRKLSVPDNLINKFSLKKDSVKLGKWKCALVNQPGHFYLTSYDICFLGSLGASWRSQLLFPPASFHVRSQLSDCAF